MKIKRVGVVGCGQMGGGISQLCTQAGYQTVVSEVNEELLNKGLETIKTSLAKGVEKGRVAKRDEETILSRLKGTTKIEDFSDCDLVIEAIIESIEEKKKLFTVLDGVCPAHTILASNTSCLSVTEMAMATRRPDQVIGMHFFNPVQVMTLLEVVTTIVSSEDTVGAVKKFGESLGKSIIMARDEPGFIVNRLLVPFLLNAVRLLEAGVATREDIDTSMALGCNHPMGPLRLADLIGLDIIYYIAEAMYQELKDHKFASPLILKRMVTAGRLGRKTGKGFYEYR